MSLSADGSAAKSGFKSFDLGEKSFQNRGHQHKNEDRTLVRNSPLVTHALDRQFDVRAAGPALSAQVLPYGELAPDLFLAAAIDGHGGSTTAELVQARLGAMLRASAALSDGARGI
eukprot:SAG11_NODE_15857_length_564_cov_1.137634_1_plen_116_part_00